MARRWPAKAVLMAAGAALLAVTVLPAQTRTLVCRFSGAIMDAESCCPQGPGTEPEAQAKLRDEGCCVVRIAEFQKPLSEAQATRLPQADEVLVAKAPLVATIAPCILGTHPVSFRVSSIGPPLILLKHSFLI